MEEAPDVPADGFRIRVVRVGMGVDCLQIMGSGAFEEIGKRRVDAPLASTDFLGHLSLVKHAHGQVFQWIDRVTALFRIIRVLGSPADIAGPAGQLSEVPTQVLFPLLVGDLQAVEARREGVFRAVRERLHPSSPVGDPEGPYGSLARREIPPGPIKSVRT